MTVSIPKINFAFSLFFALIKFRLKQSYYSIINIRKARKFKKFEDKLAVAIHEQEVSQMEMMYKIRDRIKSYYPKGRSLFIPLSLKEKREIKAAIDLEYGDLMTKHKIKLNKHLKFV